MIKILLILLTTVIQLRGQDETHVMIITGGHGFEREPFFDMFDQMRGITYEEVTQPFANEQIARRQVDHYDLLLFYDMYDSITTEQQAAYLELIDQKKPFLFLHHALVSYQHWPEFKKIVGGKYHTADKTKLSTYQHDDTIRVTISSKEHPIVEGLSEFVIVDETYGNCEILPQVTPLLQTAHPRSLPLLGWVNPYRQHEIIYLQGGHGPSAFKDPNFLKLLEQAIRWSVEKK
jgi:type 1 glutamine amidotransferase